MSLNCPKCGFDQPKDQYCANCGVDMLKHKPPSPPRWRKVLSNWVFQLALLVIVVFVLILNDNSSTPKNLDEDAESTAYSDEQSSSQASATETQKVNPPPMKNKAKKKVLPPLMKLAESTVSIKKSAGAAPNVADSSEITGAQGEELPVKQTKLSAKTLGTEELEKKVSSFFYLVPRPSFEILTSKAQYVDEGVHRLQSGVFGKELKANREAWKKLTSQSQSFEMGRPKTLFIGHQVEETGANLGYFIRMTTSQSEGPSSPLSVDIRTWSELKAGGDAFEGPTSSLELSRSPKEILLLTGLVQRDLSFSEAERSQLESHPALRALNNSQFTEENYELVLVLQYK